MERRGKGRSWNCASREQGRTDPRDAAKSKKSVQRRGVQAWWRLVDFDEMAQDFQDLPGVYDEGDHPHGLATPRAAQRALAGLRPAVVQGIPLVNLLDQSGPGGAALTGRYRAVALLLIGRSDAQGRLRRMVVSPTLGSEAQEVRGVRPRAPSPRGVQAAAANESVSCVGQVLENLGKDRGGRKVL